MGLSLEVISNPISLHKIQEESDLFVRQKSRNPFLLSAFLAQAMELNLQKGNKPLVIIFRKNEKILGLAPLLIKEKRSVRTVSMLLECALSPDFIFEKDFNLMGLDSCLSFVFGDLGASLASFDLPAESENLPILEQECAAKAMHVFKKKDEYLNHNTIILNSGPQYWHELQTKNFRHKFRKIERHLNATGKWQVISFENESNKNEVLEKMMKVEEVSWKQNWRLNNSISEDESLTKLSWEGSNLALKTCSEFKRNTWFLELNGRAIAYSLFYLYKGIAYITKTSYDNRYRKLYPGIYVNNAVVKYLLTLDNVEKIDFLTDLPFHHTWKPHRKWRIRFLITKNSLPYLYFKVREKVPREISSGAFKIRQLAGLL